MMEFKINNLAIDLEAIDAIELIDSENTRLYVKGSEFKVNMPYKALLSLLKMQKKDFSTNATP